ncbi:MAG: glycosyltransferase family 2 protein [Verrucomicrobia bacterium]|nr:glycosyltransferase family 2 protein [Prolixibacteraceae bacterium]
MEIAFWILFGVVVYTFAGYAILLAILLFFKKMLGIKKKDIPAANVPLPEVCLFVTAYNESDYVEAKVSNMLSLNYPSDKIQYLWITDGSDDGTPEKLRQYPQMEVHHLPERNGKIHAMNRGMKFVKAPIVIYSDSNTILCPDAIDIIVKTFSNPKVGCIAGEKRIVDNKLDSAAGSGENIYWKFESWVKRMDSEFNSTVGAVGELFAIRTSLYTEVENDTILDDFVISLRIAEKGYLIAYTPDAYAIETASVNVKEELKRKVRIAAGGLQTVVRLKELLNPFRYGWLSIQYISHKVLRWTIAPIALFLLFFVNFMILLKGNLNQVDVPSFYVLFFYLQVFMYLLAILGWALERWKIRFKILFVPFYFTAMNYAGVKGWIRFLKGRQSVRWEKSKRA